MVVRVENLTRGTTLAEVALVADNFLTRFVGLLGHAGLAEGKGLVIRPCSGVHMMFMRFPIDVVYVTKENRVVRVDAAMRPWQVGRVVRGSRYVVELPVGTISRSGTRVGDQIVLR